MRRAIRRGGLAVCAVALMLLLALPGVSPARAQATRTWVSGVGDDAEPCSRTAPCKTFAGAMSQTAAGGEINVLDPGGFGTVTITQSVSIVGNGFTAGIMATGTTGVIVNAGPDDVVVLRGLDINGGGTGLRGIRFLAGKALHVEQTRIYGFRGNPGHGIDMQVAADAELSVSDSEILENAGAGIYAKTPSGIGPSRLTISNTRLLNNGVGLDARDNARAMVTESVAAGNTGAGFRVQADDAGAQLSLDRSLSAYNGTGIVLGGPGNPGNRSASLIIGASAIWGNASGGIDAAPNTVTQSTGDNRIVDADAPILPPDCSPRPKVSVSTVQNGNGQLAATIVAFSNNDGGLNTIQSLNFGTPTNAVIDVPNGPSNSTGNVNAPQPALTTQVTFNVRRVAPGSFTVPLVVQDGCGAFTTFVGGGPNVP